MNRLYQMYHASSISTNAAATLTCPRRGKIRSVTWIGRWDCVADNNTMDMELSFASVEQTTVDDARGIVSGYGIGVNLGAAGADHGTIAFHDGPKEVDVQPGDRLYYNVVSAGGAIGANVRILVEIDEN